MRFKTKRDPLFVCLWLFFLFVANLVLLWPLLLDPKALTRTELVGIIVPDALVTLLLAWLALDISYVIREDLLLVKGGMFRSKIRYNDITRITRQPNICWDIGFYSRGMQSKSITGTVSWAASSFRRWIRSDSFKS